MIGFIVAGLVIGALARLVRPGKQNLSVLMTLLLGLVGSVIGGVVANLVRSGRKQPQRFLVGSFRLPPFPLRQSRRRCLNKADMDDSLNLDEPPQPPRGGRPALRVVK